MDFKRRLLMTVSAAMLCLASSAYTSKTYVQDGLIAQWDGIDNVIADGARRHDDKATTWRDLTGGGADFDLTGFFGTQLEGWTHKSLQANSCSNIPCAKSCRDYVTIEICARHDRKNRVLFNSGDGMGKFVAVKGSTVQFYNATNQNYYIGEANYFQAAAVHLPADRPVVYANGVAANQTASDSWASNDMGTCLGRGADSAYNFSGEYYAIRLYSRALTPAELAKNAKIDAVRYLDAACDDVLLVTGDPTDIGGVSPAYGMTDGLPVGAVLSCSAPASWTNAEGTVAYDCVGYKVFTNGYVYAEGDGNSFAYRHPDCKSGAELVWQWRRARLKVCRTWNGGDGFWEEPTNWTPSGVPTLDDDVAVVSGTVWAKSSLEVGRLDIGADAALFFASTGTVDKALAAWSEEPKSRSFIVAGDLTCAGTLVVGGLWTVAEKDLVTKLLVSVVGNLTLTGAARAGFYAATTPGEFSWDNLYAARTTVAVGGVLSVGGTSILYPTCDELTGAPLCFTCESFNLAAGANVNAQERGWAWFKYANDADCDPRKTGDSNSYFTFARHQIGNSWNTHACYGAEENAYGYAYAPFMAGSPTATRNAPHPGGGQFWLVAHGTATVEGRVLADATTAIYGPASGGGIWLCAKKLVAGDSALLSAKGGQNSHDSATGGGTGGRISLGLGLTAEELDLLAHGQMPSEIGLASLDVINEIPVDCSGNRGGTKDKDGNYYYSQPGTTTVVYGSEPDEGKVACTVVGVKGATVRIGDVSGGEEGVTMMLPADEPPVVSVTPDEGHEFLCWEGPVAYGQATANPLTLPAGASVSVRPVVRPVAAPTTRTFDPADAETAMAWTDPTAWTPQGIPGTNDAIVIAGKGTLTTSNYFACASLTLGSGATLSVSGAGVVQIRVTGTVSLAGELDASVATGGGAWVTAGRRMTASPGATLRARGGGSLTLAQMLSAENAAAMVADGKYHGPGEESRHVLDDAAFRARYPDVTVDCEGAFRFVDAEVKGLVFFMRLRTQ